MLVVENEEVVLRLASRLLEGLGYRVLTATSGEEALAMIEAGVPFDVLFADVVLPGMAGPETYRLARALRPRLRAVFMSGHAATTESESGSPGADVPFLQKPFTRRELAEKVRAALEPGPVQRI